MNKYETIFIINPNLETEAVEGIVQDIQNLVSNDKGEITKIDKWGKKRLAYEVRGNKDGYYVLMDFTSDSQFIQKLARYCGLTEQIIKHMTVRADDLPAVKREVSRAEGEGTPYKRSRIDEEDEFVFDEDEFEYDDDE